jgi:hypothetical protein
MPDVLRCPLVRFESLPAVRPSRSRTRISGIIASGKQS